MGVMYSVGDDVKDLLCPFIAEKGGSKDIDKIAALYLAASLGNINAKEFWRAVGLSPALEDEYLGRHKLTDGLIEFLEMVHSRGLEIWCLSNDLSEWSKKLRDSFNLGKYICDFTISGDVGLRKPDPAIFQHLLRRINVNAVDAVIVDDNPENLRPAAELGFKTILFNAGNLKHPFHESVKTFDELLQYLL